MVSYLGAGPDHGVPRDNGFYAYAEAKAAADSYLRGTGLDWTILGPGALTDRPGTGLIDVNPDGAPDRHRNSPAPTSPSSLRRFWGCPPRCGRTIEFRDGSLPIAAALDAWT